MIEVYIAENIDKNSFINSVLLRHIPAPIEILRTENGKPYIRGNPVYFNVTHSGNFCVVAVSSAPVGIDMEVYGRGVRKSVLSRYGTKEQSEINSETDFLRHWTARESYIKFCGGTLAGMLHLTALTDGILTYNGSAATPQPRFYYTDGYVLAVCGSGEITFKN